MNRIPVAMLAMTTAVLAGLAGTAVAQDTTVRAARADVRRAAADARAARDAARDAVRLEMPMALDAARLATNVDIDAAMADARVAMDRARIELPMSELALASAADVLHENLDISMPALAFGGIDDGMPRARPRASWARDDPADSIWRVARETFNRGDYRRASELFSQIYQKYPTSAYGGDAHYYQAYALYRLGSTDDLKAAAGVLEPIVTRAAESSGRRYGDVDVPALYARINGALAMRGDRDAAARVERAATQAGSARCDQEAAAVQVEALNALSQMDPQTAVPLLRRVLDRKDDCSVTLRRNAVFMLGRRADTESAALLIATAKSDPSPSVRMEAINWLPRLPGDAGLSTLEDLLRTEQDERIQSAVVHALVASDNQKAHQSMRALIERKDAPLALRVEAINSFGGEHATADDAAYLRNLYAKADNDRLKEAIIGAVSRIDSPGNDQWVLGIARDPNESSEMRAAAVARLYRSNVSVADLSKLYDTAGSEQIRLQIIGLLQRRKESEATDKLIDIVKNGTDYRLRTTAINALTRRNDPRTQQLLVDLLDKKP
jgi:HEAT repeat protein